MWARSSFEDDYFYYAVIADRRATIGKLADDGATLGATGRGVSVRSDGYPCAFRMRG
jgi:hypothetical protein